jgi:NTE family protein
MERKRVGLALGGGGARGMAHVGVIRTLEREGIPIDCLAGTSAGSLVGAAYAAGIQGQALLEMALQIRWRDIARLIWPRQGIFSFEPLESYLIRRSF